jgi:membrane protein
LIFGCVILLILLLNALAFAMIDFLDNLLTGYERITFYQLLGFILLFASMVAVFAIIFRFIPHRRLPWRSTGIGAALTSFMFTVGQFVLGWYIDLTNTGTLYGTAGAFIILLLWVYICAHITLFGALFTYLHASQYLRESQ